MSDAYVLVQTEVGKQAQVAQDLEQVPGVRRAAIVVGPYDIVARVAASDTDSLGKLIVTQVQAVDGVVRTLTCPIVYL